MMINSDFNKITNLVSGLFVFIIIWVSVNSVFGNTGKNACIPCIDQTTMLALTDEDSIHFATVILYRPDNQLTRKYKLNTNFKGAFEIAKKEAVKIDVHTDTIIISVDATGHKRETYTFILSQGKTHYFRIQDRNNYSGFQAFLEVIEVTEETFKRDEM